MYIFKNALTSITRNKGRNILISMIIIVISCATAITLAIRNSADSLITSYENQYDVIATIGINRESMRGEMKRDNESPNEDIKENKENMIDIFSTVSKITSEDIEKYGESNYVKDYYYQESIGVNSDTLEKASTTSDDNDTENKGPGGPNGKQNFMNQTNSDFTLLGYSKISAMEEFINGKYKITDGEIFDDLSADVCVINSELATLNNIKVNDEITFVDPDNSNNVIKLKVVGIFEEKSETTEGMQMFTTSANTIITSTNIIEKLISNNKDMKVATTPTFILTSKDVVEKFQTELNEKGLSEYLTLSTNLDQVDQATSVISNVSNFATTFLIITLLIGGIVLFVLNMINIRERKYEIGVLRTIGMKKNLLTLQFMSEMLIVAIIALTIGAGIGAFTSVPISNSLLQQEITSAQEQKNNINENFGGRGKERFEHINGVAAVEEFKSIDAVVDIKVLCQLFVIGILLTLISSSATMISIQNFSPLTILKERS